MNGKKNTIDQSIELKNCTYSKTILMLIIVFYHSALMYSRGDGDLMRRHNLLL